MTTTLEMDLRARIDDLAAMVLEGRSLEAFDRYYADGCVMQEGSEEPTVGKELNRKREEEFFANITEFRGAELKAVAVGDGVTMCEWHFDYTHREWGSVAYDQVAVQRWEEGLIVSERFYKAT